MPWGDGTGPWWIQGRNIRGFWRCWRFGRGFGWFGRGFRWRSFWPFRDYELTKEEEIKILEAALKDIEVEKREIEKKLKELKGQ